VPKLKVEKVPVSTKNTVEKGPVSTKNKVEKVQSLQNKQETNYSQCK
jgi:hypothetical protein